MCTATLGRMLEPFDSWSEFNVAVAGAGAALGGLLIVALSVNIKTIAESRGLAARAAASIAALILGVALCCAALIPGQVPFGSASKCWSGRRSARGGRPVGRCCAAGRGADRVSEVHGGTHPAVLRTPGGLRGRAASSCWRFPGRPPALVLVAAATILAIVTTVLFSWIALVEVLR